MRDIGSAEDWLDSWVVSVNTQAAVAVDLSRRVAALSGVAQNPDGSVKITVGVSGQIQHLHLEDSACELGGPQLADQIMSVMRAAQADMSDQVSDAVHATVGAGNETGRAVLSLIHSRFPPSKANEHDTCVSEDHDAGVRVWCDA